MILPGNKIGVLGGGQLGIFFALAARRLGYEVAVWDPDPEAPARAWAETFICAPFEDGTGVRAFLEDTRAVTYEWENIPLSLVETIESEIPVRPGSRALALLSNRIAEKIFLQAQGCPVTPFRPLQDPRELARIVDDLGLPCICKTAIAGYDGRGQWRLSTPGEVIALSEALQGQSIQGEWIVEQWVPHVMELSILIVRDGSGTVQAYPVAENFHEDGILRMSQVPARVESAVARQAAALATRAVMAVDGIGVFCVELFLKEDGALLINEIAPRPHNSGHYTMDASTVSQFEQQVRVLCGLPCLEPRLISPAVLVNVLGHEIHALQSPAGLRHLLSIPGARVYHYRKRAVKTRRKMGHVVVIDPDSRTLAERAREIRAILGRAGEP